MPLSNSTQCRLRHQHETLSELIRDLEEEQLKQRVDPAKWSAFENIAHLAAYQPMFMGRLQNILSKDTPSFERYVAEDDPHFPAYLEKSLFTLLEDFSKTRREVIAFLSDMKEQDLHRKGLHPLYGSLTVVKWTEFFLLHEAHHLFTILKLVQRL